MAGKVLSELKIFSFYHWLFLSLLVHLAIATAVLMQKPSTVPKRQKPVPITVFAVGELPSPAKPVTKPEPAAAKASIAKPARTRPEKLLTEPTKRPQTATAVAVQDTRPVRPAKPAAAQPQTDAVTTVVAPTAVTKAPESAEPGDISALLDAVSARTARRELSAAEIAALTAPRSEPANKSATSTRRPAVKPGSGPAADVLETLPDGSQLVRVGKGCVLATPGADLRKDIHSMKIVGCGAGGRTEQDRIDAHFDQVMSSIGQHR